MDTATIAAVAGARAVDLSHPLVAGMPNHPSHPPYLFTPYLRYGDFELADGYWGTNELIVMSGHSGTHIDSPAHVACHGVLFGGHDALTEQRGGQGIRHHGIDSVAPLVRRGVLLDVARTCGRDVLEAGHGVTADELARAADRVGVDPRAGDCVVVRTGWGRNWDDPERYLGERTGAPGITIDAARWLADRGVALVGADNTVVEQYVPDAGALPVHMLLLAQCGVLLLENLALEELGELACGEFLFACLPLRLKGASGSPVRAVALV